MSAPCQSLQRSQEKLAQTKSWGVSSHFVKESSGCIIIDCVEPRTSGTTLVVVVHLKTPQMHGGGRLCLALRRCMVDASFSRLLSGYGSETVTVMCMPRAECRCTERREELLLVAYHGCVGAGRKRPIVPCQNA